MKDINCNLTFISFHRMDPLLLPWTKPLQHVSTLVRQFLFDFIIIVEDCVLLGYALNSNITELQDNKTVFVVTLLGFQLIGLILKCVYYRYRGSFLCVFSFVERMNVVSLHFISILFNFPNLSADYYAFSEYLFEVASHHQMSTIGIPYVVMMTGISTSGPGSSWTTSSRSRTTTGSAPSSPTCTSAATSVCGSSPSATFPAPSTG